MRALIVGQAPSRDSDPAEPFSGASGARLAALCGLTHAEFLSAFARVNLLSAFPGKASKGDLFPLAEACEAFEDLLPRCRGREVVLLGRKVARVAGLDAPPFSWVARRAWCQHPSGINIWWNEERNVRAARRFWRDLIRRGLPRIPS